MLTYEQKKQFSSLRVELIDLNILTGFYVRKMNRLGYLYQNSTRHFILEELTSLRYMENGLILHLTNLDDDSSTYSFRKVNAELNRGFKDQKALKTLKRKIDSYRKSVNKLKNEHRNKRIAHLSYESDLDIDQFLSFNTYLKQIIEEANVLGDLIWGERVEYRFKLGTIEGILNYRDISESSKIDINAQKGFE